jgi:CBS domain-containing protein
MKVAVKDVMTRRFHTLSPEMSLSQAVGRFRTASEAEGRQIFGMMVTDADDRLTGMLSMYDILLLIQPKHIHIWGAMEDVDIAGLVESSCRQARSIRVGDVMTPEVVSVTPETHLLVVLDIMIKKHIRRIPVLEEERIEGILYISDLFHHLVDALA